MESVQQGRAPFYEPGLQPLVEEMVAARRLSATTDLTAALSDADVALLCVGTPSEPNGNLGLAQLQRATPTHHRAAHRDRRQTMKPVSYTHLAASSGDIVSASRCRSRCHVPICETLMLSRSWASLSSAASSARFRSVISSEVPIEPR